MDNYADAPMSITELRSNREEDARIATPRDPLISVLRQIDSGTMNVDLVVVAYRERFTDEKGSNYKTHYHIGGGTGMHDTIGMIERVKFMVMHDP